MSKRIILLSLITACAAVAVWAVVHFTVAKRNRLQQSASVSVSTRSTNVDAWAEAVAKVKADRGGETGGAIEIPPELKHYSDRHWFLATQVAEITKYNVQTCQDFLDVTAMIERGEMVVVPAVTDTYVLYGVGAKADDKVFTRYEDDRDIGRFSQPV